MYVAFFVRQKTRRKRLMFFQINFEHFIFFHVIFDNFVFQMIFGWLRFSSSAAVIHAQPIMLHVHVVTAFLHLYFVTSFLSQVVFCLLSEI